MFHEEPRRFFWWPAHGLTYRWKPVYPGGTDEFCNRTLGIRLPGGVLFIVINFGIRSTPCEECRALTKEEL